MTIGVTCRPAVWQYAMLLCIGICTNFVSLNIKYIYISKFQRLFTHKKSTGKFRSCSNLSLLPLLQQQVYSFTDIGECQSAAPKKSHRQGRQDQNSVRDRLGKGNIDKPERIFSFKDKGTSSQGHIMVSEQYSHLPT